MKTGKLYLYLFCCISVFAGELDIEDILRKFDKKSHFTQIKRLKAEKLYKEETGLRQNRNKKVDYRGEIFKESSSDNELTRNYDNVEKGQLTLMYDALYYQSVYEFEESNNYIDRGRGLKESRIGVRKTLNDLIYSEKDYEKNYIEIKKKIVKNDLAYDYINHVEKIIDSYREILAIQQSIETDEGSLDEYKRLYKIAVEKEKLGEGLRLETRYLEVEAMEAEERINYSKNLKEVKIYQLGEAAGIQIEGNRIFSLFPTDGKVSLKVNDYDVKKSKNEAEMLIEELKLKKRNEQTELTLGGDYDTERELWSLRVTLDGSLFDYKLDSSLRESEIEIAEKEIDNLEGIKRGELKELTSEYSYLKSNLRIKKLKVENRRKTLDIAREMYRLGYITARELIDEKSDYREAKLEYLEVFSSLGAFEYKMLVRERVERMDMIGF